MIHALNHLNFSGHQSNVPILQSWRLRPSDVDTHTSQQQSWDEDSSISTSIVSFFLEFFPDSLSFSSPYSAVFCLSVFFPS